MNILLIQGVLHLGLYAVFMGIAHLLFNLRRGDEVLAGNTAAAIRRTAFYVGIGIALYATFTSTSNATSVVQALIENACWGIGVLAVLFVALWVNDVFIIPRIDNAKAISEGNIAMAIVEAASILGSAFIMTGTMKGEGPLVATIVFFLIGQLAMVGSAWLYELLTFRVHMVREVSEGNVAAGVLLAGKILAAALIISTAITGDFTGWAPDIAAVVLYYVAGLVVLVVTEFVIDLVLLPGVRVEDLLQRKAVAPMVLLAGVSIASAMIITAVSPL